MANMKEVAEYAGVSVSTVSRVLSNTNYVNDKTREKVLRAVKKLNYKPNSLAKGLKMGYTNAIALMIPSIQNRIFPVIVRGVEDTARKNGFTVILCNTDENIQVERDYIKELKSRWIDGFIVSSMLPNSDHIRELQNEDFPVVLTGRNYDNSISAVVIDNYAAAYNAVSYLIKTGNKRIALASGKRYISLYQKRYLGYIDALKDNGIELDEDLIIQETDEGVSSFYYLIQRKLKSGIKMDAVFATTDSKALVIMRAIMDLGFKIPDDISVLGFDNIDISAYIEPTLSTVSQPLYEMGSIATKKLINMIKKGGKIKPSIDILKTELIIRNSTR